MPRCPTWPSIIQVVAIDQRGYNLSDKPEGVENYAMEKLVGDVAAVIKHFRPGQGHVVGHDWGGMVAWTFAMTRPEMIDRLIILNLPHPRGPGPRAGEQPRPAEGQPVRPRLPEARRRRQDQARDARLLGQGRRGPQGLRRGVQAVVDRGDAQLLQGQLPARTRTKEKPAATSRRSSARS